MSFVFKKFFSKGKDPKTPTGSLDMTQSMIDFITEDYSPDDSFRSVQPHFERSFSAYVDERRYKSDKAETEPDFSTKKTKLNISSVLNTPKRGTLIEDLYGILQEQVIDQVGEMLQPTKRTALSPKLLKEVQQKDFDLYISRLRKVYDVYKRNNALRFKQKQNEQTNMTAKLLKCYEIVPSHYFEDNFKFNFKFLVKDRGIIMKTQEDLTEYLDMIDESLYFQVTNRFEEFLDIILKINKMEVQIHSSLYSVKFLRNYNQEVKTKLSQKVTGVLQLKRRKIHIEKTLALLDLISVVKKTLPTLVILIQKNNFDSAVKLIKTSEETCKTKLKQVKSLKNFNFNFNEARSTLEKLLTSEFENRCINYLTPTLSYQKISKTDEKSLMEESFLQIINEEDKDTHKQQTSKYYLTWKLDESATDSSIENNISKIILEFIKIKDFPLTVYKGKLLEVMKKFHKKFMNDVQEFNEHLNNQKSPKLQSSSSCQNQIPFELYLKFIVFYFEVFKRFLSLHLHLNTTILSSLIEFYNYNFVEKNNYNPGSYPFFQVLDTKASKDLSETVQEFYLTLAMIFKYFNDRLSEVIQIRSIENITLKQFSKLVNVLEHVLKYFQGTLNLEEKLNSWIVSDKETIKKPLMRLVSTLSDKISLSPLKSLVIEMERNFINQYHKKQQDNLRVSLEQESWQRADINPESLSYFKVFTDSKFNQEENSKISDSEEKSGNPQEQFANQNLQGNDEKKEQKIHIKIENNEICFQENKFQVIPSLLLLIQNIHDYSEIGFKFKFIGLDAISKTFEMIKFYNSYTTQLILGAAATTFGKVNRITAKILGLSSMSLSLLVMLIDPLYKNITQQADKINQEWLNLEIIKVKHDINNHILEIGAKVKSILKSKLIEQANELKKLNWANIQEKITTPTKYSVNILTNTTQMCKQTQGYLLHEQLKSIIRGILDDINTCLLPVYENINVESGISAKRVKEELQYFSEKLLQIPAFQESQVNFSDFEDKIISIIEDKCNHYLEATLIN